MNKKLTASISLLIVAFIWGISFIAQSKGMDYLGPYGFTMYSSIIGAISMIILLNIKSLNKILNKDLEKEYSKNTTLISGLFCGIFLFLAMNAQQLGLLHTTPGKAGFIATLYIIIIPIIERIFGKKVEKRIIICLLIALVGMYFLSVKENFSINIGDIIIFLSAIFYAIHTIMLSKFSTKINVLKLNLMQFLVAAFLSFIFANIFKENISLEYAYISRIAILYMGILSSGIAFTLQIIALREIDPAIAALINSLESIFAALGGYLILNQVLNSREILGCIILFIATILAQIPNKKEQ